MDRFLGIVRDDPKHRDLRLATTLHALSGAGVPLAPYITSALAMYLTLPDAGDEVGTLFNYAARPCMDATGLPKGRTTPSPELEALALKLLKAGAFTEGPLGYLGSCSNSGGTLDALRSIPVPDSAANDKERALRGIQRRLPKKPQ